MALREFIGGTGLGAVHRIILSYVDVKWQFDTDKQMVGYAETDSMLHRLIIACDGRYRPLLH